MKDYDMLIQHGSRRHQFDRELWNLCQLVIRFSKNGCPHPALLGAAVQLRITAVLLRKTDRRRTPYAVKKVVADLLENA